TCAFLERSDAPFLEPPQASHMHHPGEEGGALMTRKTLLICGVVSSALYVGIDLLAAIVHPGYHSFTSQAISELGANGAPTKRLVDPLFLVYDALLIAFGIGVWKAAAGSGPLRTVAVALIGIAVVGLPTPWLWSMNMRGSAPVSGDVPHIIATGVIVLCTLTAMGAGCFALGSRFRVFSVLMILTTLLAGTVTSVEG